MTLTSVTDPVTPAVLSEDLRTAWVPDALGNVDMALLLNSELPTDGTIGPWERFEVPRPVGLPLVASMLSAPAHGALHRAVHGVRDVVAAALEPGVCGYRRGAEEGFSYSAENLRFQQFSEAQADASGWVVFADVKRFFEHCTWDAVVRGLASLPGSIDMAGVYRFAESAKRSGLHTLPAGYADARLLANAVLASADAAVEVPFARWVDDYRLFASSKAEAEAALGRLRESLAATGLVLNESKVAIMSADEFHSARGLPLASVYHPDADSHGQVKAALRTVFLHAAQETPASRRELRFALPRLAEQGDDIAVDWALKVMDSMPWETPRLAAYLHSFRHVPEVRMRVERALVTSLDGSTWQAARLAALACHTGVFEYSAELAVRASSSSSPALRGLLLRALSLSGHGDLVDRLTSAAPLDPRVALAARRDVGLPDGHFADLVPSETLAALQGHTAPRPIIESIL